MPIQFGSHKILHLGVLLLGCISGVCPANIVILHPAYSGSHHIALRNFGDHLVSRGHNVTQIKFRMSNANHVANTQVNILDLALQDPEGTCAYVNHQGEMEINKEVGQLLWNRGADLTTLPRDLFCLAGVHCQSLFYDPDVIRLFNETRFDLAIVDLIANECGVALAKSVHVPIVTFWGFSFQGGEVALTSNFNNPAIVPTFFSALGIRMNFLERTYNFVLSMIHYGFEVRQANIAQGFISERFPDLPPVGQMIHDLDMHFVNTDFYVDTPKAMSPNTKYIGGIHLREGHPLPQEYDDFYRDAHHGVILFSMGYTGFHPEAVPSSVIANFLTAFGRLQQKVIVKYDKDFIPFTPSNVMVVDWVPQQDILAHPKTVAFVSHCGMFGVSEAIYHRVPIVGVPIFGDQVDNAKRLEDSGLGVRILSKDDATADYIYDQCMAVLTNTSIHAKVNHFADMWRDRPLKPVDEATYWIEFLIKHQDVSFLRIDDYHLSFVQYFCLDVIGFLLLIAVCMMISTFVILDRLYKCWKAQRPQIPEPTRRKHKKKNF